MLLVPMKNLLVPARAGGYALGAFEFWSLDSAQAVLEAAAEVGVPVILQAGPLECTFAGGPAALAEMARLAAKAAGVPVALHLDHAEDTALVAAALAAGFSSVMIDASALPYAENIALTAEVVRMARRTGASVEAELGRLLGSEGGAETIGPEAQQTDPDEAREFVARTGIDALAVAVGTAHGLYSYEPRLNLVRLEAIARHVDIPLVLHGGSGTPHAQVLAAIKLGIAKVNICTEFVMAYGIGAANAQRQPGFKYSVPALFGAQREAGKQLAREKIRLFACQ